MQELNPQTFDKKDIAAAARMCRKLVEPIARENMTTIFVGLFRGHDPSFDPKEFRARCER